MGIYNLMKLYHWRNTYITEWTSCKLKIRVCVCVTVFIWRKTIGSMMNATKAFVFLVFLYAYSLGKFFFNSTNRFLHPTIQYLMVTFIWFKYEHEKHSRWTFYTRKHRNVIEFLIVTWRLYPFSPIFTSVHFSLLTSRNIIRRSDDSLVTRNAEHRRRKRTKFDLLF